MRPKLVFRQVSQRLPVDRFEGSLIHFVMQGNGEGLPGATGELVATVSDFSDRGRFSGPMEGPTVTKAVTVATLSNPKRENILTTSLGS